MIINKKESNVWLPTQLSAVKLFLIQIECSINESYKELGGKTLFEYTVENKNDSGVLKILPTLRTSPLLGEYKKVLPLDSVEFLYQSVYKRTGGVLNLFHAELKEDMDTQLKDLIQKNDNDVNKAIKDWKTVKSELWSSLTPNLVWAGGGKLEKELLFDFCNKLTKTMGNQKFYSQGGAIIKAVEYLRAWQLSYNEICKDTPMNAIIKEREEIFNKKVKFLKEMNISCDFS